MNSQRIPQIIFQWTYPAIILLLGFYGASMIIAGGYLWGGLSVAVAFLNLLAVSWLQAQEKAEARQKEVEQLSN